MFLNRLIKPTDLNTKEVWTIQSVQSTQFKASNNILSANSAASRDEYDSCDFSLRYVLFETFDGLIKRGFYAC
jgi:hypothetical protein